MLKHVSTLESSAQMFLPPNLADPSRSLQTQGEMIPDL